MGDHSSEETRAFRPGELRARRQALGYRTQAHLAERLGCSQRLVSMFELGQHTIVGSGFGAAYLEALGLTLTAIGGDDVDPAT